MVLKPAVTAGRTRHAGRGAAQAPIAVVGIGCRLPGGVDSASSFWALLMEGRDALTDIPADRWSRERFYEPEPVAGKSRVSRGGFLTQPVDRFDPAFFGISPREADSIDPQQRLLLEVAWEAIEDAGVPWESIAHSYTGVYTGGFTLDYSQMQFAMSEGEASRVEVHTSTGSVMTMMSNRISHAFDLLGPSMSIDTACSSSLVAIHQACQSIWNGESEQALAGGVNLMLSPNFTIAASTGGFLSPTSTSRAFDSRANGYVRGEGAALVYLKPLDRALADGDRIYATIRGTGVSQDGHTNGITVPNGDSQQLAMRAALTQAGADPLTVDYVEAHGTGTPVGDPIEAAAIGQVYGSGRRAHDRLRVGSVKTNIGHLEAAAGVAGLIKAALTLYHRRVPQHLNLQDLNPAIDAEELSLDFPAEVVDLRAEGTVRAAVNSFGFGGTNAHAVLETAPALPGTEAPAGTETPPGTEAPATDEYDEDAARPSGDSRRAAGRDIRPEATAGAGVWQVVPLTARSERSLRAAAGLGADALAEGLPLDDLAAGLVHRRTHHPQHRAAVVAPDGGAAETSLRALSESGEDAGALTASAEAVAGPLAFVYTGMGPQWWGMARGLLTSNPVFRAAIERCDEALGRHADWSLLQELSADEDASRIGEAQISQPANFAIQYALTELWRELGVEPALVVGHSAGEVAAAWAAGCLTLDEAITVIYHRSRVQHRASGEGRLLAVGLSAEEASAIEDVALGRVELAAVNSPDSTALVGSLAELEQIAERLGADGVFARLVPGDVPYHSRAMDRLEDDLRRSLIGISSRAPRIPLYSTVTGAQVPSHGEGVLDAEYWWRNVRDTVRFADATARMLEDGAAVMLEVGPTAVLAHAMRQTAEREGRPVRSVASLDRKHEDGRSFARAIGQLWAWGVPLDFSALSPRRPMQTLPAYPWDHGHYWSEGTGGRRHRLAQHEEPYLGNRSDAPTPVWRRLLDGTAPSALGDHVVQGATLFPGAGFAEIVAEVARSHYGAARCTISDLRFTAPLIHRRGETYLIDTVLDDARATVRISGRRPESDQWTQHASARILPPSASRPTLDLDDLRARLRPSWSEEETYARFDTAGFSYGPAFRTLRDLQRGDGEALARLHHEGGDSCPDAPAPVVSPVLLDAAFQLLLPLALDRIGDAEFIPMGVEEIIIHGTPSGTLYAYATADPAPGPGSGSTGAGAGADQHLSGDALIVDDAGRVLVEVRGFTLRTFTDAPGPERLGTRWLHELGWEDQPLLLPEPASGASTAAAVIPGIEAPAAGTWLLVAESGGLGEALAEQISQAGGTPVLLGPGHARHLRPDDRASVARALDEVFQDHSDVRGVVHLLATAAGPGSGASNGHDLDWTVREGPLSLIHLAAELDGRGIAVPLTVVTTGAQVLDGMISEHGLHQSSLLGIGRVLHHELLGLESRLIDLDPTDPEGHLEDLLADLLHGDSEEDQIAYRAHQRQVLRLNPSQGRGGRVPRAIRSDGTYLVTGGLGALGALVTQWLADSGAGTIVLTSRSGLPPREQWEELQGHERFGDAVKAVLHAEARGVQVRIETVDITDVGALGELLERLAHDGHPPLRGLVHSAGAVDDQILIRMNQEQLSTVLTPKIQGGWALHQATLAQPLEFFVLFSSVSAIIPSPGQGNYAAANTFLDALAHYRRSLGLPGLSLNWGPWDAGMIAQLQLRSLYAQRGIDLIDVETGIALLTELLGSDDAQQGVVSAHWPTVVDSFPLTPVLVRHLAQEEDSADGDGISVAARLAAATTAEERRQVTEEGLTDIVCRVLRLNSEELGREEPLSRAGLDSMIATELRIRIEQVFGTAPSIVTLLADATIESIAAELWAAADGAGEGSAQSPPAPGTAEGLESAAILELMADLDDAEIDTLLGALEDGSNA